MALTTSDCVPVGCCSEHNTNLEKAKCTTASYAAFCNAPHSSSKCCGCIGKYGQYTKDNCQPLCTAQGSTCTSCLAGTKPTKPSTVGALDHCADVCGCGHSWYCTDDTFHQCTPSSGHGTLASCRQTCGHLATLPMPKV